MAGIGVAALVLLPVLPIVLVAWGVYRLKSPKRPGAGGMGSAKGGPIVAVIGGLLLAAIMWPALLSGNDPASVAAEPAAGPPRSAESGTSPSHNESPSHDGSSSPDEADSPTGDSRAEASAAHSKDTDSPAQGTTRDLGATAGQGVLVPVVSVSDGDTIRVRVGGVTERVRIIGIDTPELTGNECYAQQAASEMQSLVQSKSVRIAADPTQDDRDRYGRLLRHVSLEDGRLVGEVMLEGGYGREYTYAAPYEHQARYRAAQARAQSAGLGLWGAGCAGAAATSAPTPQPAGTATPHSPANPRPSSTSATPKPSVAPKPPIAQPAPSGSCTIKGNISSKGEKIYHVPGGRSYAETKIDPSKGERWFCSTSEAVAAGWRAALR